jgi:DNA ligase 1
MIFKPLLAPPQDPLSYPNYFKELQYPLLVSPKYDGIRAIVKQGTVLSRTGKPLPSFLIQDELNEFEHFDGEIIVGNATDHNVYNRTQSHVMAHEKIFDFKYYVFDYTHPVYLADWFDARLNILQGLVEEKSNPNVVFVPHQYVDNYEQLLQFEEDCLFEGFEGVMLRSPIAPYKQGRGTWREGIIMKLKRFHDAEAYIVGFKEQFTNTNVQERDELGYAKRSYKLEGMEPADTLGAFLVAFEDDVLEIAPGNFNHAERKDIWDNGHKYIDKILKFRYFKHGVKDKPRFPRAIGFRDKIDL